MTAEERTRKMLTEPVERLVCVMAVPTILTMLITTFYNMADTYFVGQLDTYSTAAVGLALPLMNIMQAFGFLFGQGSGNFIAHRLGRGETDIAKQMGDTALILSFGFGAVIAAVGLAFLTPLVRLLGALPELEQNARDYMGSILLAAPFCTAGFTLNQQLRLQGEAAKGTVGMGLGSILNMGLDPLLIFVFHMGVAGAAVATAIGQTISFFLLMGLSGRLRRWRPSFKLNGEILSGIFRYGTPSVMRQGVTSVGNLCMNHVAGRYSAAVIAALAVVQKIIMVGNNIIIGLGQGFQPVCGFNLGAGRTDRVYKLILFCLKVMLGFMAVFGLVCYIFAPTLIHVFRDDPEVEAAGAALLRFQCITILSIGVITLTNMLMQNMGRVFAGSFLAVARQGLFYVPLLYVLTYFYGVEGLYVTQALSDLLTAFVALPILISTTRRLKQGVNLWT